MSETDIIDGYDELQDIINEQCVEETVENSSTTGSKDLSGKNEEWMKTDEEKRLEKLLFGDKEGFIKKLELQTGKIKNEEIETEFNSNNKKRKVAWHDSDDDDANVGDVINENRYTGSLSHVNKDKTYKEYLTNKFQRITAPPKWAEFDRDINGDSDEEILHTVGHLVKSTNRTLPQNNLDFKRLKDLNRATYAEGSISSIQFHPTSTVALVAGSSGIASIYSIDGTKNDKLHNVKFKNFPIRYAKILPNGTEALLGSNKNYFYSYDLMEAQEMRFFLPKTITKLSKFEISPCGKYFAVVGRFGEIHLMDLNSKELLHTYKQENPCCDLKFTNDSKKLITHSKGSEICIFDLRKERIEHSFIDDGCIIGKTIDISPNSQMLATGSNEGVCNIYTYAEIFKSESPKPQKIIYNLTTSLSTTKFNSSSEMLAICSETVPGAVKLLHFPTGTIFANFPGSQSNVGQVKVVEFSPNSGFLAMGNCKKEVPLFRLKHYKNY